MNTSKNLHIITGASSGIGAALAKTLAKKKTPLALWARRKERLETLRTECLKLGSPNVLIAEIDVRNKKAIQNELNSRSIDYAGTFALIANAGMARGREPIDQTSSVDWDEMIDINIKGLLYSVEAVLPLMLKNGGGDILLVGSVAGHTSYPGGNVYAATKAAVKSLTEGLRFDLNGKPIRVMEISPGATETEFSITRYRGDLEKAKSVYKGMTPLSPEDVAETMAWMLGAPRHMTLSEVVIYPTDQAHPMLIHRRT